MFARVQETRGGKLLALSAVLFTAALIAGAGARAFTPPAIGTEANTPKAITPAVTAPEGAAALSGGDKALSGAANWQYESNANFANAGGAVVTLGDVNGDGISDFAVGAAGATSVRVFFGAPGGPSTTPSQTITVAVNSFGTVVAPAGDVNGDGYADMLTTAPYAADGRAYVYYGSSGGLQTATPWVYSHLDAGFANASFGASAAGAGDVNGDGYDDIVVGIPFSADGNGAAYVFFGGSGGLASSPGWSQTGGSGWEYGSSVSGAGDVNGDGYADVVVGMPGLDMLYYGNQVYGGAYVYHGYSGGLSTVPTTRLFSDQFGAFFGAAVAGAGDVNGDGYGDVVVGAPLFDYYSNTDGGEALIYPGSAGGVTTTPIWYEYGIGANYQFGAVVATAGDVNGDGLADVVVGVPAYVNGYANGGSAYVVQGSRSGSLVINWYILRAGSTAFGSAVGTAGDVNNDGFSDLIVGSLLYSNGQTSEGQAEIFYGAGNAPYYTFNQSATGGQSYPYFAWVTTGVGDVNGDGYSDVVVSGPTYDVFNTDDGAILLYLGSPTGLVYWAYWVGEQAGANFGYSVAAAGDVNGDGYGDVIIGAPTTGGSGKAYALYGGPSGPTMWVTNWSVSLGTAGASFGTSVAAAGDVNGDGYGDVIVGAPNDDNGQTDEGRAYVFLGSATGLSTSPARTYEGNQDAGHLGNSVASAGDVNRDGFSDVIVGMESWDHIFNQFLSLSDVGRAYVYLGGVGGPAVSPAATLEGGTSFQQFGHCVAPAGDVDGDGYSDVIVGANLVNGTYTNEGQAAVFRGYAGGVLTSAHWTFLGGQAYANLGASVAGAGDVNGDGLSDVIVGAVFADANALTDNGVARVFAGPLTGGAATNPIWTFAGQQSWENVGHVVASAGDVNGDGFADVLTGGPGYGGGTYYNEGRMLVFMGNALYTPGEARDRAGRMRRGDDGAPVALLGRADGSSPLRLKALGGSAAGRAKVRLEWELDPFTTNFDGLGLSRTGWTDNGASGVANPPTLDTGALARPAGNAAHWRLRVASRSPFFPHTPWLVPAGNGPQETDLIVRDPALSGVGDAPRPLGGALLVDVAPNPFNPRTTIAFENAAPGPVRVELFDLRGRSLGVLLAEDRPAGRVELLWDGRDGAGRAVASGTYFARVRTAGQAGLARLTLLK